MKFKVGDRVRRTKKATNPALWGIKGQVYTVLEATSWSIKVIQGKEDKFFADAGSFEPAGPSMALPAIFDDVLPDAYASLGPKKCECGAHAVKSERHSTWCPLYREDRHA